MKRNLSVIILAIVLCTILVCNVSATSEDPYMYTEFMGKWKAACEGKNIGTFQFLGDGRLIIDRGSEKLLYGYIPIRYDQEYARETGVTGVLMMQPNSDGMPEQWDVLSSSKNQIKLRTSVLDEVILSRIK